MARFRTLRVLCLVAGLLSSISFGYSGGSGTEADPYQIATAEDLNDIGNHLEDRDKHFILVNDVNLAEYTGTQFNIIGSSYSTSFIGVFDGNDHKVWNFTWSSTGRDDIGLFGYVGDVGEGGQIKNLGMENVDVNAVNGWRVGGLVGNNYNNTITNCYSTGSVSGYRIVGGLVGDNSYGTITNCYSTGSVSGTEDVGGLVGHNGGSSEITNCYSTGSVSGTGWDVGGLVGSNGWRAFYGGGPITNCYSTGSVTATGNYVGGLVGENWDGTITNCYSTGNVSGTSNYVGGLVGYNDGMDGTVTNCYSTGNVSGTGGVGGLVGVNGGEWQPRPITNCYSTGSVSGNEVIGGLVGVNCGPITKCYSTGSVTGNSYVGGLVGANSGGSVVGSFWDTQTSGWMTSAGGTGKTTAEMKTMSTFTEAGWDFVEIWGIGENQTYPYLRTEPAGDLNHDKKVDFADFAILASHWLEGS